MKHGSIFNIEEMGDVKSLHSLSNHSSAIHFGNFFKTEIHVFIFNSEAEFELLEHSSITWIMIYAK